MMPLGTRYSSDSWTGSGTEKQWPCPSSLMPAPWFSSCRSQSQVDLAKAALGEGLHGPWRQNARPESNPLVTCSATPRRILAGSKRGAREWPRRAQQHSPFRAAILVTFICRFNVEQVRSNSPSAACHRAVRWGAGSSSPFCRV